jgi:hypothetical protein
MGIRKGCCDLANDEYVTTQRMQSSILRTRKDKQKNRTTFQIKFVFPYPDNLQTSTQTRLLETDYDSRESMTETELDYFILFHIRKTVNWRDLRDFCAKP